MCGATDRLVEKDPSWGDHMLWLNGIVRQKYSGNINNEDKRWLDQERDENIIQNEGEEANEV